MTESIYKQERPQLDAVIRYFKALQDDLCDSLSACEISQEFSEGTWEHANGGGGRSRVLEGGAVFEKGGVNFSHVIGDKLPATASASRPQIAGKPFAATGVSLVMHPLNPFVPTVHMNVRMFVADPDGGNPTWWFGGGYDLTPYYGFEEDCVHWHQNAKDACDKHNAQYYAEFKAWCDRYFFLKHRDEARGIGGLFFDDFVGEGFDDAFAFVQSIGDSFIDGYLPIVKRRRVNFWDEKHTEFQQIRRGRYVEFNLVHDRGTIFGLQSGGRTESILMSLPPKVQWKYDWRPEAGSDEELLFTEFLPVQDWLGRD